MMKRLFAILLSLMIFILPLCNINYSYAEDNSSNQQDWLFLVDAEHDIQNTLFVSAFKAYLNANKTYMAFSYPYEKAIVNWSYDNINKICSDAGLGTIEDYYNQVAVAVDKNGNFKFWYKAGGIELMDQLFKAYLQHYGILTNDETKRIFAGKYFEDNDGYSCYITIINEQTKSNINTETWNNICIQDGTTYRFHGNTYYNNHLDGVETYYLGYNNRSISYDIYKGTTDNNFYNYVRLNNINFGSIYQQSTSSSSWSYNYIDGGLRIFEFQNNLYLGYFDHNKQGPTQYDRYSFGCSIILNGATFNAQIIDLAKKGADNANLALAKNAVLDVGKMGAEIGVAAVNYIEDEDETDPDVETPEEDPDVNTPKINIPVGIVNNMPITISLPNLDDLIPDAVPQIPHGFTIPGLRYKFPFCIPFDLIAVYEVLDTTPEAPHFETEINFATFNYNLDIDLEDYNPYMVHIRNYFLILYIFGLLFITPKLLKA